MQQPRGSISAGLSAHKAMKKKRRKKEEKILKEYGIPQEQQIVPRKERFPDRQKLGMIQENK